MSAYDTVRSALIVGLSKLDVELDSDNQDALALARLGESRGILPPEITDAFLGLNVLHNLAKHSPAREMSPEKAYEYLAMADGALYALAMAFRKHTATSPVAAAA